MSAFYWVCVALVVITGSARLTRLATVDKLPPVVWLRQKYEDATDGSGWQLLTLCGYCFSFWATAFVVLTGELSGIYDGEPLAEWMTPAWWLLFGTLGGSYLAAILMAYDGDDSEDD